MNLTENCLQLGFLLYFCCTSYKYFRHPVLPKTSSRWNVAILWQKRAIHAGWSDQIPIPIADSFFPYKMLRERGGKETLNSTTKHQLHIYLCVTLLYAQLKETSWVQKKQWPLNWWRDCKAKSSMPQEAGHRVEWDFSGEDATAWEIALWLLLRQNADFNMRSGQTLWSFITCIPQPQLGPNGYMNFMVVPGLTIYGQGSIIFRVTCWFIPHGTIISVFLSQGSTQGSGLVLTVTLLTVLGRWSTRNKKPLATPSKTNKKSRFQGGLFLMGGLFQNFEASYCPHFSVLWTRNLCFCFWYQCLRILDAALTPKKVGFLENVLHHKICGRSLV